MAPCMMLPMLHACSGHPRPRPRRRVTLEDHTAFRCPSGAFLGERGLVDRTPRLQRHVRQALARGLLPSLEDASTRQSQNATLFYTHESAQWPKPAACRTRRPQVCAVNPHFCVILPYGNAPRTSLVSDRHGIEFRQVWKVASSSLASFFFCNMWEQRVGKRPASLPLRVTAGCGRPSTLHGRRGAARLLAEARKLPQR